MVISNWEGGILPEEQWGSSSDSLVSPIGRMSARTLSSRLKEGEVRVEVTRNPSLQQREINLLENPRQFKTIGVLYSTPEPSTLLAIARGGTDARSCGSLATRRQFRTAAIGLGLSRIESQLYPNEIKAAEQDRGPLHLLNLCAPEMNKFNSPTVVKWLLVLIFILFESSIPVLIFFSKDGLSSTFMGSLCVDEADEDECVAFRCAGMCEIKTISDLCPRTCRSCTPWCDREDTWNSLNGLSCNITASSACDFETVHDCRSSMAAQGNVSDEYINADRIYCYDSCSGCGECTPDLSNHGEYPFNIIELVLVVEVCKFVFFGLILVSKGICRRPVKWWDLRIFALLAPFDVGTFWFQFLALKYLTPSQFAVLFNVDMVFTTLFVRLGIQLKVMRLQWFGLMLIITGSAQLLVWEEELYLYNWGVMFVFLAALVSSVWNFLAESYIGSNSLDGSKLGVLQNMFMSTLFSAVFSGIVVVATIPNFFSGNSLVGLTPGCWFLCLVLVCYEICLLIIRDMLNLFTVAVISALAIPLTLGLDYIFFLQKNWSWISTGFSAVIVTLGVLLFNGNHLGFSQHLRKSHIEMLFPPKPEPVPKKKRSKSKSKSKSRSSISSSRKKKRKRKSLKKSKKGSPSRCSRGKLAKAGRQASSRSKRTGSSSPSFWLSPSGNNSRIRSEVSNSDHEIFSPDGHSRRESQRSQGGLMPEYFS